MRKKLSILVERDILAKASIMVAFNMFNQSKLYLTVAQSLPFLSIPLPDLPTMFPNLPTTPPQVPMEHQVSPSTTLTTTNLVTNLPILTMLMPSLDLLTTLPNQTTAKCRQMLILNLFPQAILLHLTVMEHLPLTAMEHLPVTAMEHLNHLTTHLPHLMEHPNLPTTPPSLLTTLPSPPTILPSLLITHPAPLMELQDLLIVPLAHRMAPVSIGSMAILTTLMMAQLETFFKHLLIM